ncbi:MAG: transcriptional regulator [Paludibacteraceae bacterium]|nr:transcriptional regulator [Paludibacteraceae bacterium]
MACSVEYIEYVCQQLSEVGNVRSRKMMGDYIIYLDEKPVITACDNLCYVKKIPVLESIMADAECGCPYPGAKEHYILDIDHKKEALNVVKILWKELPFPKKKK